MKRSMLIFMAFLFVFAIGTTGAASEGYTVIAKSGKGQSNHSDGSFSDG